MDSIYKLFRKNEELGKTLDLEIGKEYTYMYEKVVLEKISVIYGLKEIGFWKFKKIVPEISYHVAISKKGPEGSIVEWQLTSAELDYFVNHLLETYNHKNLLEKEVSKLEK